MEALPAGPAPAPRNQLIIGTAVASVAMTMLIGGMLSIWALQRREAIDAEGSWLPSGVTIPEVPSNVMLIAFVGIVTFAHWAQWSANRNDRANTVFALASTAFVSVLVINAQFFVYSQMDLGVTDGAYGSMFYAITGTFLALMIAGTVFTLVAMFRFLGGRTSDRELLDAHVIFWYAMSAVYAAIWFVVYVTK